MKVKHRTRKKGWKSFQLFDSTRSDWTRQIEIFNDPIHKTESKIFLPMLIRIGDQSLNWLEKFSDLKSMSRENSVKLILTKERETHFERESEVENIEMIVTIGME